jgi:hypothetical protein
MARFTIDWNLRPNSPPGAALDESAIPGMDPGLLMTATLGYGDAGWK